MLYTYICNNVAELTAYFGTNNPFDILKGKDIDVLFEPLGRKNTSVKGFFYAYEGAMSVTINSELSKFIQMIIAAHELAHAVLHENIDIKFFHERTFLDDSSSLEREANMFAAELLIGDEDVLSNLDEGKTLYEAAASLSVPVELLLFKIKLMNRAKGYNIPEPSLHVNNNFLLKIEVY